MFGLGLHTEILTPLSIILLIIGAVLGYGGKYLLKKFMKNPTEKAVLVIKLVGLAFVGAGVILIFTR